MVLFDGIDLYFYYFVIFDCWGEILFELLDIGIGWDGIYYGKLVKEGVYIWKIIFKDSLNVELFEWYGLVIFVR